jgi:hypothetical protein
MRTLGEDIVLLAIQQDGKLAAHAKLRYAVAGSELVRLAAARRVDVVKGRIVVLDASPTGDPLLDAALASMARSRRAPHAKSWVSNSRISPEAYLEGLARGGVVRKELHKALKLFPTTRWSVVDLARYSAARSRLDAVALSQDPVDSAQAALGGLVHAVELDQQLYPGKEGHAARDRLKRIARRDPSVRSVEAAVRNASHDAGDAASDAATHAAVRASVDAAVHASIDAAHHAASDAGHHGGGGGGGGHH